MKTRYLVDGCILLGCVAVAGCESLLQHQADINGGLSAIQETAHMLDPVTGGWASTVAYGVVTLATTALAINRHFVAKNRGKIIKAVHTHTETPSIYRQLEDDKLKKIARRFLND